MAETPDILDGVFEGPRMASPAQIEHLYEISGRKHNVNPALLRAQNAYELGPRGGAQTAGDTQHIGYGQLGPAIRRQYGVTDPTDPAQTIDAQAAHMRTLLDKHDGDSHMALTEYTGGPNQANWGPHTQAYASHVLANFPKGSSTDYEPDPLDSVWQSEHAAPAHSQDMHPSQQSYPWGAAKEFVNALDLGYGPEIHGSVAAGSSLAHRLMGGTSLSDAMQHFGPEYTAERDWARRGQQGYEKENPGSGLVYSGLGTIAPAVATLGAGGELSAGALARGAPAMDAALERLSSEPGMTGWLTRRAMNAVGGAAGGLATAAQQLHLNQGRPVGEQLAHGAEFGGIASPVGGAAIEPLLSHISPVVAQAAQKLRGLGVNVPAGAVPGSAPILHMMNSVFGDGGETARTQLTSAVGKTFGESRPLTSDVLNQNEERISKGFKNFAQSTGAYDFNDSVLKQDLRGVLTDASKDRISDEGLGKLGDVAKLIHGGGAPLTGEDYLQLTKRGGQIDRLLRDPEIGEHAINIRDALDDSLERGVASGLGHWTKAPPGGMPPNATNIGARLANPGKPSQLGVGLPEGFDSSIKPGFQTNSGGQLIPTDSGTGYRPNWESAGMQPPLEGSLGSAPQQPPGPNMQWVYDPGAEGLLGNLRDLRAQWRNLKTVSPIIDDSSGQVDPSKLATAVDRGFKRNARAQLAPSSQDLRALGQSDNFIPDSSSPGLLSRLGSTLDSHTGGMGKFGVGAMLMGATPALVHELPNLEADWKPLIMGMGGTAAAYGAGKGVNALVQGGTRLGAANTERILGNAANGEGASEIPFLQALMGPAIHLTNDPTEAQQAAAGP